LLILKHSTTKVDFRDVITIFFLFEM